MKKEIENKNNWLQFIFYIVVGLLVFHMSEINKNHIIGAIQYLLGMFLVIVAFLKVNKKISSQIIAWIIIISIIVITGLIDFDYKYIDDGKNDIHLKINIK